MATAKIIENRRIIPLIFRMILEEEGIAKDALPGQFVNIRVGDGYYPLLRRPMSVHWTAQDRFAILYNIRGTGTELLSTYKKGDRLNILGPLGNSFESLIADEKLYLIAGGIGVAPLYFLYKKRRAFLIMGARDRDAILPEEETGSPVDIVTTEDGSIGEKGLITDHLPDVLEGSTVISCGPIPMLKKIKDFYSTKNVNSILSLEARMGCGYGVCLSCAIKTKKGYKYVCKDGPAFRAEDIEL